MAFFQPQQRVRDTQQLSFPTPEQSTAEVSRPSQSRQRKRSFEESEEWVLFSPSAEKSVQHATTSSTERTPITVAQSPLSDFGSFDTLGRSEQDTHPHLAVGGAEYRDIEAEELDSLDEGLHAFHERPNYEHSRSPAAVLPSYDGFGSFQPTSAMIQKQLWELERQHNARQMSWGRTPSLQVGLDALHKEVGERDQEEETRVRVEKWRLEQSKTLLEEIGRETRRLRRWSRAGSRMRTGSLSYGSNKGLRSATSDKTTNLADEAIGLFEEQGSESLLRRFTRKVIRDLIGINDDVLAIIVGETHISEDMEYKSLTAASPGREVTVRQRASSFGSEAWQYLLLERIAHGLGTIIHQIFQHPGAFSTFLQVQEIPPYVGTTTALYTRTESDLEPREEQQQQDRLVDNSHTADFFSPTLTNRLTVNNDADTSIWGVEEDEIELRDAIYRNAEEEARALRREREHWERELDIKMVFGFFKNRFSSRNQSPTRERWAAGTSPSPTHASASAPSTAQKPGSVQRFETTHKQNSTTQRKRPAPYVPAHRAAIITQQHPLASAARRRELLQRSSHRSVTGTTTSAAVAGVQRRHQAGSSSCASQSTRKSRRTGSTRNYWDIGSSSVGSGAAASIGVWGDV